MLELIYDSRETKLNQLFLNNNSEIKNIEIKSKYLDLGDIIFKNGEETILIIERKTLSDLYSSIQDGRYKEQKIRLLNNYDKSKIVYLIENSSENKFINKKIIDGAILNMIFRDKLKIIRTKNLDETYNILLTIGKKIIKNPEFFISNHLEKTENINQNYLETIKIGKKDNMTPKICNIVQLSQIPGVSKKIAELILDKYGSIKQLILEYNKLNEIKDKETMLKDISYKIGENKQRKIGPVISKRIYEYYNY